MTAKQHIRRLAWPSVSLVLSLALVLFRADLTRYFELDETVSLGLKALAYFAAAWLVSRVFAMALDRAGTRSRPYPRLLNDIIAAILFLVAFVGTTSLFMGQGAFGALAGSGLVLAMLGFAIRNVVADTLSGVALGIEGPFRIGDWVDIDGLARGKVVEIGWRTTRVLTRDSMYLILPNSQIARQRITNYSAPKPHYRAQVTITLDHTMPIEQARKILLGAVREAKLIQHDPAPDVRVFAYEDVGIIYAVRYWLSRFDRDIDCRDEVYGLVDDALRRAGTTAPRRRIELMNTETATDAARATDQPPAILHPFPNAPMPKP
ncbi:mechanosensitive ion channel family protein [Hoeflea sp. YIM 152468]|uniref:mechanosensitive ion channel family protein n=1 Tax=Hoeflea sp. YIM 152468 TaxID=3031759 RepID=UPI0023D9ECBC|nr:mechanosensitive ion channel family protein [Hoeflea sp. YIM 152468]MDF1609330.1 mechanosensitive ion channel family protein [Hoeflea sp. YIM 152468]